MGLDPYGDFQMMNDQIYIISLHVIKDKKKKKNSGYKLFHLVLRFLECRQGPCSFTNDTQFSPGEKKGLSKYPMN